MTTNPFPTKQELREMEFEELLSAMLRFKYRTLLDATRWVQSFGDARAEGLDIGSSILKANEQWNL